MELLRVAVEFGVRWDRICLALYTCFAVFAATGTQMPRYASGQLLELPVSRITELGAAAGVIFSRTLDDMRSVCSFKTPTHDDIRWDAELHMPLLQKVAVERHKSTQGACSTMRNSRFDGFESLEPSKGCARTTFSGDWDSKKERCF